MPLIRSRLNQRIKQLLIHLPWSAYAMPIKLNWVKGETDCQVSLDHYKNKIKINNAWWLRAVNWRIDAAVADCWVCCVTSVFKSSEWLNWNAVLTYLMKKWVPSQSAESLAAGYKNILQITIKNHILYIEVRKEWWKTHPGTVAHPPEPAGNAIKTWGHLILEWVCPTFSTSKDQVFQKSLLYNEKGLSQCHWDVSGGSHWGNMFFGWLKQPSEKGQGGRNIFIMRCVIGIIELHVSAMAHAQAELRSQCVLKMKTLK